MYDKVKLNDPTKPHSFRQHSALYSTPSPWKVGEYGSHEPRLYELRAAGFAGFYSKPHPGASNLMALASNPSTWELQTPAILSLV